MHDEENLILTGFMGTGKTSVGRELARRLNRDFVDMDVLIETRERMTIAEIFRLKGETYFRRLEAELCRELAARSGLVIATGGGALIPEENHQILGASGPVICLTASPEEIFRRLQTAQDRPLLAHDDRWTGIQALLAERAAAYQRIPLQIDTGGLTVDQVADRVLALVEISPVQALPVRYPGGEYPIYLGRGLLSRIGELMRQHGLDGQVALVTNPIVGSLYAGTVMASLEAAGFQTALCTVPDGEAYKALETVQRLYDLLIEARLDRHGVVLALGGGVIGDLAGFVAATYLRGIALVQVPTTLLAIVDASVGGKVAVDHPRGKNLIGTFKQPRLVIADLATLASLPPAEQAGGLAETVKAGLIADPALFRQIEDHGPAPLPWLIERALRVKIAVVEEDPYEQGRRAVLNLGHTFGHAIELLSGYTRSHGAAVSVGLVAATHLSARLGWCEPDLTLHVEGVLRRLGLPTREPDFLPDQILEAMVADKKRLGSRLRFVLLRAVGEAFVTDQVKPGEVLAVLDEMRDRNTFR